MTDLACIYAFTVGDNPKLERRNASKTGSGNNEDEEWMVQAAGEGMHRRPGNSQGEK